MDPVRGTSIPCSSCLGGHSLEIIGTQKRVGHRSIVLMLSYIHGYAKKSKHQLSACRSRPFALMAVLADNQKKCICDTLAIAVRLAEIFAQSPAIVSILTRVAFVPEVVSDVSVG